MLNQLPSPTLSVHEVENGYVVVHTPTQAMSIRDFTFALMNLFRSGLSLASLGQMLSSLGVSVQYQQEPEIDEEGVGDTPGSPDSYLNEAGNDLQQSLSPFEEMSERQRPRLYICPDATAVLETIQSILGEEV